MGAPEKKDLLLPFRLSVGSFVLAGGLPAGHAAIPVKMDTFFVSCQKLHICFGNISIFVYKGVTIL